MAASTVASWRTAGATQRRRPWHAAREADIASREEAANEWWKTLFFTSPLRIFQFSTSSTPCKSYCPISASYPVMPNLASSSLRRIANQSSWQDFATESSHSEQGSSPWKRTFDANCLANARSVSAAAPTERSQPFAAPRDTAHVIALSLTGLIR